MAFTLQLLRKSVTVYLTILTIGGAALAILAITLLSTTPVLAIAPKSSLIGGMLIGVLLMLTSALGAVGAHRETARPALYFSAGLVAMLIGMTLWGVWLIGGSLSDDVRLESNLSSMWDTAPTATIVQIESWGQCCGFASYTDRFQEPCEAYTPEVGCLEPMRKQVTSKLTALLVPSTFVLVGQGIGLGAILILLWALWRHDRQAKLIGERQPFDAWHKAVFQ
jgi:hypothetical protein